MTHPLMMLFVLFVFCASVGYGLAINHANAWFMLVVCVTIWITVPLAYVVGVLTDG